MKNVNRKTMTKRRPSLMAAGGVCTCRALCLAGRIVGRESKPMKEM